MKRREFLSKSASGVAGFAVAPAVFTLGEAAFAQAPAGQHEIWHQRPLRIYHPNARSFEMETLDVGRFIADCKATGAEAVVVSAGGIYAFYPSKVKYHYVLVDYLARPLSTKVRLNEESSSYGWFSLHEVERLDASEDTKEVVRKLQRIGRRP